MSLDSGNGVALAGLLLASVWLAGGHFDQLLGSHGAPTPPQRPPNGTSGTEPTPHTFSRTRARNAAPRGEVGELGRVPGGEREQLGDVHADHVLGIDPAQLRADQRGM